MKECLPLGSELNVFPYVIRNVEIKTYRTEISPVVLYGCETWSDIQGGTD
jgi:hypothetical protein